MRAVSDPIRDIFDVWHRGGHHYESHERTTGLHPGHDDLQSATAALIKDMDLPNVNTWPSVVARHTLLHRPERVESVRGFGRGPP